MFVYLRLWEKLKKKRYWVIRGRGLSHNEIWELKGEWIEKSLQGTLRKLKLRKIQKENKISFFVMLIWFDIVLYFGLEWKYLEIVRNGRKCLICISRILKIGKKNKLQCQQHIKDLVIFSTIIQCDFPSYDDSTYLY